MFYSEKTRQRRTLCKQGEQKLYRESLLRPVSDNGTDNGKLAPIQGVHGTGSPTVIIANVFIINIFTKQSSFCMQFYFTDVKKTHNCP